jgi:hypothetical protein
LFKNYCGFLRSSVFKTKENADALFARNKFWHGFVRMQKRTPKFILCHAYKKKIRRLICGARTLLIFCLYSFIAPVFVYAFLRTISEKKKSLPKTPCPSFYFLAWFSKTKTHAKK